MSISQALGWIGAIGFGFCGAPQAYQSVREGHSKGLTWGMLSLWTLGEVATFTAVVMDHGAGYLIANYVVNGVFLGVMLYYKIRPRQTPEERAMEALVNALKAVALPSSGVKKPSLRLVDKEEDL